MAEETQFSVPVDGEHKALQLRLWSFAKPHMLAFHLCWFAFFTSFVSTFAPAAMIPVVRESLNLTADDLGNAGAIVVRGVVVGGTFCPNSTLQIEFQAAPDTSIASHYLFL
jgi:MFS transporter, NNP family, nitrate/nitrite transporter